MSTYYNNLSKGEQASDYVGLVVHLVEHLNDRNFDHIILGKQVIDSDNKKVHNIFKGENGQIKKVCKKRRLDFKGHVLDLVCLIMVNDSYDKNGNGKA